MHCGAGEQRMVGMVGWWRREVYKHLSVRKLRGRTAALLLWPPAGAASRKCKPPALWARSNMDIQAPLITFHTRLSSTRMSIRPREAHGLPEANTTLRLDVNNSKGPSQDTCKGEFHRGRKKTQMEKRTTMG